MTKWLGKFSATSVTGLSRKGSGTLGDLVGNREGPACGIGLALDDRKTENGELGLMANSSSGFSNADLLVSSVWARYRSIVAVSSILRSLHVVSIPNVSHLQLSGRLSYRSGSIDVETVGVYRRDQPMQAWRRTLHTDLQNLDIGRTPE